MVSRCVVGFQKIEDLAAAFQLCCACLNYFSLSGRSLKKTYNLQVKEVKNGISLLFLTTKVHKTQDRCAKKQITTASRRNALFVSRFLSTTRTTTKANSEKQFSDPNLISYSQCSENN